jgi:hypothetical protein
MYSLARKDKSTTTKSTGITGQILVLPWKAGEFVSNRGDLSGATAIDANLMLLCQPAPAWHFGKQSAMFRPPTKLKGQFAIASE